MQLSVRNLDRFSFYGLLRFESPADQTMARFWKSIESSDK